MTSKMLSEITSVITKGTTPTSVGCSFSKNGINYIKSESITSSRTLDKSKYAFISEETHQKLKRSQIKENDILFSMAGMFFGKTGIVQADDVPANTNQAVAIIRIVPEQANYLYVYYYLNQKNIVTWINSLSGQSAQPNINLKQIGEIEIPLPDRIIQDTIVEMLSAIDSRIELNTAINENLEQQAQALFKNLIADIQERVPFTSVIQVLGGGTPKTGKQEYWNGEIPFFTPKDVGTPYVLTTEKNITPLGLDNCNSRLYPVNTVFLTARGTVGKVSLAGVPMSMNQSCYALAGKDGLHQIIVYHYVLETVKALKHKASGAVFDAIITRDFDTESVPALSSEQIDSFIAVAEPIYSDILNRTIENQRLAALRDTLLPKLMNGEIDVLAVKI